MRVESVSSFHDAGCDPIDGDRGKMVGKGGTDPILATNAAGMYLPSAESTGGTHQNTALNLS